MSGVIAWPPFPTRPPTPEQVARVSLPSARNGPLAFAQVHEDPLLEIAALRVQPTDHVVVVASGGCTALSLLAAGAGEVTAVDLNSTQNHLVELKRAAVLLLDPEERLACLGATRATARTRSAWYARVRPLLTPAAQEWWDAHRQLLASGALNGGRAEQMMARLVEVLQLAVHSRARIARLLACRTLDDQRALYHAEWNSWRWRALFRLLVGRPAMHSGYDAGFAEHAAGQPFAEQFRERMAYTLCELPVANNYFLHHLLTGAYPADQADGVPPYLSAAGAMRIAAAPQALTLVDGTFTEQLRRCRAGSVNGFVLSNICEWLSEIEIDALFAEVARAAAPGARLCFRNFVGWTEVPARWRQVMIEDRAEGARLLRTDRGLLQRRFVLCHVRPEHAQ